MRRKPTKRRAGGEEPSTPTEPGGTEDLPERWSAQRKAELVLRLLRGEALDAVSRESQVPAHELESWKHPGSLQIPHGGPSEIVWDAPDESRLLTSSQLGTAERLDGLPVPVKDPRNYLASFSLHLLRARKLSL
jgi:transposase-like protein